MASDSVEHYVDQRGRDVYQHWVDGLADLNAKVAVIRRIDRVAAGNLGDCKPCREGVWELRIDLGPGYRIYYGQKRGGALVVLAGGIKRNQNADIARAVAYWRDLQGQCGFNGTQTKKGAAHGKSDQKP